MDTTISFAMKVAPQQEPTTRIQVFFDLSGDISSCDLRFMFPCTMFSLQGRDRIETKSYSLYQSCSEIFFSFSFYRKFAIFFQFLKKIHNCFCMIYIFIYFYLFIYFLSHPSLRYLISRPLSVQVLFASSCCAVNGRSLFFEHIYLQLITTTIR